MILCCFLVCVTQKGGLFSQGFSGQKGAGGTHDEPTGYIAPVKNVAIPNRGEFTFSAYLTIGTRRETALCFEFHWL